MKTEIFDVVFKSIQRKLLKYPYVKLSDNFIKDFISEKINKNLKEFGSQKEFVSFVTKVFEKTINSIIKASLGSDDEYLELINRYLELAKLEIDNSDKDLVLLTNLVSFLNRYQFESTPEKLIKIISNNLYLFNSIKYFVDKNSEKIANGKVRQIVADDNVFSFIEAYCMYQGIEIEEELNENAGDNQEDDLDEEISEFGNDSYYNEDSEKFLEHEIRQYDVLSHEDQMNLFRQYQSGDEKAKEKLVETNLRLVLSIAKKHRNRGVELLDLFQEGTTGLITAITKFDLNMNCALSTYATWWIKQAITRTIQYHAKTIRIPVHMAEASNKLIMAQRALTVELGREPTNAELAKRLKISEKKLLEIYDAQKQIVSLNTYVNDDNDTEMEDLIPSEEVSIEESVLEQIKSQDVMNLLNRANLTEKEIDVLIRRFGILDGRVMRLEEIGSIYGVTRERIRQIETKAINKLRKSPYTKSFASYMANPEDALDSLENYRNAYVGVINTNKKFIARADLNSGKIRKVSSKHTIYKYLSNYSKEDVDALIETLSPASKELLRIRFGNDLENPIVSIEWNDEYHRRFNKLLYYMRKYLENPNCTWRIKPIYNYFPRHDSLEVDLAIATLTDEEQALLKLRYGDNLHYPTYNIDWEYDLNNDVQLQIIIGKISQILSPMQSRMAKDISNSNIYNIYDYFAEFSKENVDLAISLLSEEELSLLKIKFGENLDEYYTRPNWKIGQSTECSTLLATLKRQLSKSDFGHRYTIYELLSDYTKVEIDLAISKITNTEIKDKLYSFLENGILTKEDKKEFNSIKYLLNRIILKIRQLGLEKTIYEIYSEYDEKVIDYVLAGLNEEEFVLLSLKFGTDFHVPALKRELLIGQQKKIDILFDKINQLLIDAKNKNNIEVIDIYDYFAEYPIKDVADVISRLSEEELNLLKLKFGDRLTLYSRKANLSEEQTKGYKILLSKIRRMLANPVKGRKKKFFDVFSDYEIQDINNVLKILSESDRNYLKYYYGKDLNEYPVADENVAKKIWIINAKIRRQLENFKTERISIYTYFSEYTKEDVDLMLLNLSEQELLLLKKKFCDDLSCMIKRVNWTDEEVKAYIALSAKMKRLLKKPRVKKSPKIIKNISIYEYFKDYSETEVNVMLARLTESELTLLHKKFGNNLDCLVKRVNWSEEELKSFKSLSVKMRRILKNPTQKTRLNKTNSKELVKISIYEYFKEYTKEDIDLMLSKLSNSELIILRKKFGENLDCLIKRVSWSEDESKLYVSLSAKMRRLLKKPNPKVREKKVKEIRQISIYEYFKKYTKDEVDMMISKLDESELKILYKKFGSNLDSLVRSVNWSEEEAILYKSLYSKMHRLLKNPNYHKREKKIKIIEKVSIYQYFKDYTEDEVNVMLAKLTENELKILHKKFGNNLDNFVKKVKWDDGEQQQYVALSARMRRLLKKPNHRVRHKKMEDKVAEKISIYTYFNDYSVDEVNVMLSKLTEDELNILHKKFGINLDSLVKRVNWNEEEHKNYMSLSIRMRRLLKNPVPKIREKKTKQKVIEKISIYQYFKDYSEDEVNTMLSKLTEDEMSMIYRKFGNQLDCLVKRVNWSDEEAKNFKSLSAKIRRLLKNPNPQVKEKKIKVKEVEKISIYQYFNKYTEDEINEMLARLNASELTILRKKFGEELDNLVKRVNWNEEEHKLYISLYSKMQRLLKNPNRKPREIKPKKVKEQVSIYAYFKEYSEEDVNVMLAKLTDSELKILYKKFGNNLDCLVRRVNWIGNEQKEYSALHNRMHRLLKNPNPVVREKKIKETVVTKITIYQYFKDYSADEINAMLSKLTENDLKILHKKFGENLDCLVRRVDWDNGEERHYTSLMAKIKRLLANPTKQVRKKSRKSKNLYELFGKYSSEMINQVLSSLTQAERDVLVSYYGTDLTQKNEGNQNRSDELNCILDKIGKNLKAKSDKPISLYDYFAPYSRDDIDKVLSKLSYSEKYLLMQKFDADYSCYRQKVDWSEEDRKKYTSLMVKIRNRLKKIPKPVVIEALELVTIYEIFKGYSKEQIDWAVSTLSSQDKYSIKSRYGDDLSKAYVKPDKSSHRLMGLLYKVKQKLNSLPASEQPKSVIEKQRKALLKKAHEAEVKNLANNVVFHQILSMLPRVESVMLELKFGLYGKIYSTEEIAKLFNKSETDIIKIIRCALEDVKVLANPVSDEIIKLLNPINDTDLKLVLDKKED